MDFLQGFKIGTMNIDCFQFYSCNLLIMHKAYPVKPWSQSIDSNTTDTEGVHVSMEVFLTCASSMRDYIDNKFIIIIIGYLQNGTRFVSIGFICRLPLFGYRGVSIVGKWRSTFWGPLVPPGQCRTQFFYGTHSPPIMPVFHCLQNVTLLHLIY